MELNKDSIDKISFTCYRGKYYLASEVDNCLDVISEAADKTQEEIAALQERIAKMELVIKNMERQPNRLEAAIPMRQPQARQPQPMDGYAQQTPMGPEAMRGAGDVISKAAEKSAAMLRDAEAQYTRVIAAGRSAYYNALQFKQDLAQQYRAMDSELDRSLEMLRELDVVKDAAVNGGK